MEGPYEPTKAYLSAEPGDKIRVCATGFDHIGSPADRTLTFTLLNKTKTLQPEAKTTIDNNEWTDCHTWTIEEKGYYQVLFKRPDDPSVVIVKFTMKRE
ncbi:hypothetical protein [Staphylospora marina]|uniref:hypothetical protein n=1 Tax=Staphylospora marina TaxID=2490858 RepID=UPI000F5BE968|nr:hypothetical protein [Staphylospora marina]